MGLTSSCCTRGWSCRCPLQQPEGRHRDFPHWEVQLCRCPLQQPEGRHRDFPHWEVHRSLLKGVATCDPGDPSSLSPGTSCTSVMLQEFPVRIATQFALLLGVFTATPCEKVDTVIFSKAVQRVSRQSDAPSGPSPSGGSLYFTQQDTGETHSKSLRFQGYH